MEWVDLASDVPVCCRCMFFELTITIIYYQLLMARFFYLLIILLSLLTLASTTPSSPKRSLRGGGGGRSKSYYTPHKNYMYGRPGGELKPFNITRYNAYWNATASRTYEMLTEYYLPPYGYYQGGYNDTGYKSYRYGERYWNGYGYNFYFEQYAYYHDDIPLEPATKNMIMLIAFSVCGTCCICCFID